MCEETMKNKLRVLMFVCVSLISIHALASTEKEKIYLVHMINQLDALRPLAIAASKEQEKFQRVQFHYLTYKDSDGYKHSGVLDDIDEIKKGIQIRLASIAIQPREFSQIKGDYVGNKILKVESYNAN